MAADTYTTAELDRYREVQKLAYACAMETARGLTVGVTEREAAARLGQALAQRGVRHYFHIPFAWFGDRTTFVDVRRPTDFLPTRRRIERGMCAILDVAPVVEGFAADMGYAFSLGRNELLEEALDDLTRFRTLVLELVRAGKTQRAIYRAVDELLRDLGYTNCHQRYPFGVLAHRVHRLPPGGVLARIHGVFGLPAALQLIRQVAISLAPGAKETSPFWSEGRATDVPVEPGLWAVEPHIAKEGVGAKWEELLVVTPSDAYWLDDELPHVQRTPKRAAGSPQRQTAARA